MLALVLVVSGASLAGDKVLPVLVHVELGDDAVGGLDADVDHGTWGGGEEEKGGGGRGGGEMGEWKKDGEEIIDGKKSIKVT